MARAARRQLEVRLMATTFFLNNAPVAPRSLSGNGLAWTGAQKALLLSRGAAAVSQTDNTIANLIAQQGRIDTAGLGSADVADATKGFLFLSNPLKAVTITSIQITINPRGLESSAKANYGLGASVGIFSAGGLFQTWITDSAFGPSVTELGTAEGATQYNSAVALSHAIPEGGFLVAVPTWSSAGGAVSASGFTATAFWNGPTAGASGDFFVTFTETIEELDHRARTIHGAQEFRHRPRPTLYAPPV
jgi:hypothetical protein